MIATQCNKLACQLIEGASLKPGSILVVGCSTSEVIGKKIGTCSNTDIANEIFKGLKTATDKYGVYLAVQCCEHLNRAIVIEKKAVPFAEYVNVVPQIKAGGALSTVAYEQFDEPVVLEGIKADAGIDIGDMLIGMHLKQVAVPFRSDIKKVGEANVVLARTRAKFIGGERAIYNKNML